MLFSDVRGKTERNWSILSYNEDDNSNITLCVTIQAQEREALFYSLRNSRTCIEFQ